MSELHLKCYEDPIWAANEIVRLNSELEEWNTTGLNLINRAETAERQLTESKEREAVDALRIHLFSEEVDDLRKQLTKVRAEVSEWVCDSCQTVYSGPPQKGFACVQCPKCAGNTMPKSRWDVIRARQDAANECVEMVFHTIDESKHRIIKHFKLKGLE